MSSNRNKSFTATMAASSGHLHFPLYSEGRQITVVNPDFRLFSKKINISNYLLIDARRQVSLQFYFRCTDDYYHIYVRTPGAYYGRALTLNDDGALVALPAAGSDTTSFNLTGPNNDILTLDNIHKDNIRLQIHTRSGTILHTNRTTQHGYPIKGTGAGIQTLFDINIIERNAPYLSNPDEI